MFLFNILIFMLLTLSFIEHIVCQAVLEIRLTFIPYSSIEYTQCVLTDVFQILVVVVQLERNRDIYSFILILYTLSINDAIISCCNIHTHMQISLTVMYCLQIYVEDFTLILECSSSNHRYILNAIFAKFLQNAI